MDVSNLTVNLRLSDDLHTTLFMAADKVCTVAMQNGVKDPELNDAIVALFRVVARTEEEKATPEVKPEKPDWVRTIDTTGEDVMRVWPWPDRSKNE
jgi:hypothetical protein